MKRCSCCGYGHYNSESRCLSCAEEGRTPTDDVREIERRKARKEVRESYRREMEWDTDDRMIFVP